MASREEKEAAVAQAMGYKGAEALREEAAERLKEQMLAEVRRQQEALRNPSPFPCPDDGDESAFTRLRRSKRFWYVVFGTLLFLYMAFLIRWVCNDLAK